MCSLATRLPTVCSSTTSKPKTTDKEAGLAFSPALILKGIDVADKDELQALRNTVAAIVDDIDRKVIDTDELIENEEWRELAETAKNSFSKLLDKIDDAIDQ